MVALNIIFPRVNVGEGAGGTGVEEQHGTHSVPKERSEDGRNAEEPFSDRFFALLRVSMRRGAAE